MGGDAADVYGDVAPAADGCAQERPATPRGSLAARRPGPYTSHGDQRQSRAAWPRRGRPGNDDGR